MATHILKTDPDLFEAVNNGIKSWEIRKDDRGFQVGDTLILTETQYTGEEMASGKPLVFTGRELRVVVPYIKKGPFYNGLVENWVIMSIIPVKF